MRPTDEGAATGAGSRTAPSVLPLREAACRYWRRRGLPTDPVQVAVAPGAPLLLLAVLAAAGGRDRPDDPGSVLLPHPCSSWYGPQARALGRAVHTVPVPVECGGTPDPFALLETVRRARGAGQAPRVLVLSVADDVTGTAAPPELLHEVCEAAVDEGLLIVSDESWRDTSHDPHDTVFVSPAEMLAGTEQADHVVVLAELGSALLPPDLRAGIARFPGAGRGRLLGEQVHEALGALHAPLPGQVAAVAAEALSEPEPLLARRAAEAGLRGTLARALHSALVGAGALCRPPHLGRYLYADLDPLRPRLAARGVTDAPRLEAELVRALGPYAEGGHHFGDDPRELRVRLSTDLLTAAGARRPSGPAEHASGELPGVAEALAQVQSVLADLTDGSPQ